MMPEKAIYFGQLRGTGERLPPSGHKVEPVTFTDANGEIQLGFFKPVEFTYPELLVKCAVGLSVAMEMSMGGQCARDYLVFDDAGKICGSISAGIIKFAPMLSLTEPVPLDTEKVKLAAPSKATMLSRGMTGALVGSHLSSDDDAHPGNIGTGVVNDAGCGLTFTAIPPDANHLSQTCNKSRYIFTDNELYYFNKPAGKLEVIQLPPTEFNELRSHFAHISPIERLSDAQLRRVIHASGHIPDDMLLYVLIDNDLRYADEWAKALKTLRMIDGVLKEVPAKALPVKSSDWDNFPNVDGKTFFPPYFLPGNWNMTKAFKCYQEVQGLAADPAIQTENGPVTFQQQMFYELLKYLVTFDPETLRARLYENFADIKLDYLSLPAAASEILSKQSSTRYNTATDQQPFVDYMVGLVQKKYDEAYRAIVFYLGCKQNKHGAEVSSFLQFLQSTPSAWRRITDWTKNQNEKQAGKWSSSECYFKPETLLHRYHQIWRDSRVLLMQDCLFSAKALSDNLSDALSLPRSRPLSPIKPINPDDPELSAAWPLIDSSINLNDLSVPTDCQPDSALNKGLNLLNRMIIDLHACAKQYYELQLKDLSDQKNMEYSREIHDIVCRYRIDICESLDKSSWSLHFNKVLRSLSDYQSNLDFYMHREKTDSAPGSEPLSVISNVMYREHTDKDIVDDALTALFDWAKRTDQDELNDYINTIIKSFYVPSQFNPLADRKRAEDVLSYLKTSMATGDDKLGRILAVGGQDSTSLNTLLITHLMPLVLKDSIGRLDCNLHSLSYACQRNQFNVLHYTKSAAVYARKNPRFTHLYTDQSTKQINDAMYHWVNGLTRAEFAKIVNDALGKYELKGILGYFTNRTRGKPTRDRLDNPDFSNQQVLAFIFSEGAANPDSSLSSHMFNSLISNMQSLIPANRAQARAALERASAHADILLTAAENAPEAQRDSAIESAKKISATLLESACKGSSRAANHPGYDGILDIQLKNLEHIEHFLPSLRPHSKDASFSKPTSMAQIAYSPTMFTRLAVKPEAKPAAMSSSSTFELTFSDEDDSDLLGFGPAV